MGRAYFWRLVAILMSGIMNGWPTIFLAVMLELSDKKKGLKDHLDLSAVG
jgi:hypothetical protein